MNLSQYLTEGILSKRTGMYGPNPTKEELIAWVDENGFEHIKWSMYFNNSSFKDYNCYLLGPNMPRYNDSDWLKVHNKDVYALTFWFDSKGNVRDIEYDTKEPGKIPVAHNIEYPEAMKILISMVK